jgi:hypothetical protein
MNKFGWLTLCSFAGFAFAIGLRLQANKLAWPDKSKFHGVWDSEKYANNEAAYIDVAYFLTALSIVILGVASYQWLKTEKE